MQSSSSVSCVLCSKKYKNPSQLQKHYYLCRLLHASTKTMDVTDDVPPIKNIYIMLLELGKKYNILEEKYNLLLQQQQQQQPSKRISQKKIDFVDWLNIHSPYQPSGLSILSFLEKRFTSSVENIERLFTESFMEVLDAALIESNFDNCPILVCKNILYGYEKEEDNKDDNNEDKGKWNVLPKERIVSVLNKLKRLLFSVAYQHRLDNRELIKEDEKVEEKFDLMINKIVSIEVSNETTYNKMKKIFIKHLPHHQ